MSKHEKALKRERRKVERGRRALLRNPQSAIRNGAAALAAAAAIAGGTQAYASPVRFDNPAGAGHFDWANTPDSIIPLDLLLPASAQPPGVIGATTLRQGVDSTVCQLFGDPELQTGLGFPDQYFLVGTDAGELIPTPGTGWWSGVAYASPFYGYPSLLPDGVPTYLGVRFDLGSGFQYGWIGVVMDSSNLYALDAFAWGYETEPGVSIPAGAPEPGTLALLAFGAAAALRKRRTA